MTHVFRNWYQSTTLGDGITLIHEIHVEDWLRCNIWPFHGRNMDLIIDTGMGLRPLSEEIAELSERLQTAMPRLWWRTRRRTAFMYAQRHLRHCLGKVFASQFPRPSPRNVA